MCVETIVSSLLFSSFEYQGAGQNGPWEMLSDGCRPCSVRLEERKRKKGNNKRAIEAPATMRECALLHNAVPAAYLRGVHLQLPVNSQLQFKWFCVCVYMTFFVNKTKVKLVSYLARAHW